MCRWWCLCHVTIQGSNMVAAVDNWSCYIESDKLVSSKQQDCRGVEEASVATIHQTPDSRQLILMMLVTSGEQWRAAAVFLHGCVIGSVLQFDVY